jgi:hypothetical protein
LRPSYTLVTKVKAIPSLIVLSAFLFCALCPWLFPMADEPARVAARTPPLDTLTHIFCQKPLGLKDGISIQNYILCEDGTRIPFGGRTLNGRTSGLVYRCAVEGKPLEVWTYGKVGLSYRFVQIICGDRMVLDYAHGVAGIWPGMPSYGRFLQAFVSLLGWAGLLIWTLIRLSRIKALA